MITIILIFFLILLASPPPSHLLYFLPLNLQDLWIGIVALSPLWSLSFLCHCIGMIWILNFANGYFFLQPHQEIIRWCIGIIERIRQSWRRRKKRARWRKWCRMRKARWWRKSRGRWWRKSKSRWWRKSRKRWWRKLLSLRLELIL